MKFTVTPESVLALLNQVGKGQSKRKRENSVITFSAARNRIRVIGNGMSAGLKTPVSGRGQFQMNLKNITDLLSTYPQTTPVQMVCSGGRLEIGSFSLPVQNYQSEPVPEKADLPPPKPARQSKKPETTPQRQASADGYSPPPPYRDDDDCTGVAGMVSAEDFRGSREPAVCPVCHGVGYFEKRMYSGGTYYRAWRTWVSARDAVSIVVLSGTEETILCPNCLDQRGHGSRFDGAVAGIQPDIFDKNEAQ